MSNVIVAILLLVLSADCFAQDTGKGDSLVVTLKNGACATVPLAGIASITFDTSRLSVKKGVLESPICCSIDLLNTQSPRLVITVPHELDIQLSLFNTLGIEVSSPTLKKLKAGQNTIGIETLNEALLPGYYFCIVKAGQQRFLQRCWIQK